MLERSSHVGPLERSSAEPIAYGASTAGAEQSLGDLVRSASSFLRRQYLVILLFTLIANGLAILYLGITPPTYTARAKVIIGTPTPQFIQQQSMYTERPVDSPQLENHLQIIQSKTIALSVIRKLSLANDPEFHTGLMQHALALVFGANGRETNPKAPESSASREEAAVPAFADRLAVTRVGVSYVVEISFSSRDAEKAARIANAVANEYIVDQVEARYEANRVAANWLQQRLSQLREQTATAEQAANTFKQQHNIVAADGKFIDDQQVTDLNGRLVAARANAADLLARLNQVEAVIRKGISDVAYDATGLDLPNPILTNLRQQYLEMARRASEWSNRYGRDHLAVVNLRNRMRDIRAVTYDELRRIAETVRSDYEIAKKRQEDMERQLSEAISQSQASNKAQVTLRELESNAKSYRNLYETFLQRYVASAQQESFPISEARLIASAATPAGKSKPRTALILALSLMGGIGLGAGVGLLRDATDRVFRTSDQLQELLQIPCLALAPLLNSRRAKQPPKHAPSTNVPAQRTVSCSTDLCWTSVDYPLSPFAESIRSMKLATSLYTAGVPNKVIGFTSSLPNEGKSTISAALALLAAHARSGRVLLVDCDLRNPSLSNSLAPNATVGLVDVIAGAVPFDEAVWRDPLSSLHFLPTIKNKHLFHTSELLASAATSKLFDKLRSNFDYIVVDLPPLAPVIDARAAVSVVDCMILVVEWGRTKIDVVKHALDTAPNVREALIGAVLNKTNMNHIKRYDLSRSDIYNKTYYARYHS